MSVLCVFCDFLTDVVKPHPSRTTKTNVANDEFNSSLWPESILDNIHCRGCVLCKNAKINGRFHFVSKQWQQLQTSSCTLCLLNSFLSLRQWNSSLLMLNLNSNHAYWITHHHLFCSKTRSSTSLGTPLARDTVLHSQEMIFICFSTGGILNMITSCVLWWFFLPPVFSLTNPIFQCFLLLH